MNHTCCLKSEAKWPGRREERAEEEEGGERRRAGGDSTGRRILGPGAAHVTTVCVSIRARAIDSTPLHDGLIGVQIFAYSSTSKGSNEGQPRRS